jgi:ferredoxin
VDDLFILDECICRNKEGCNEYPRDIGCMALGPGIARMHPSHGRKVTKEEAVAHVRKAAKEGLVASFAHVWIDPVAFGLSRFHNLMFICFCCDCCSLYRTHMTDRGPNLERGLQKLPGISVAVDAAQCTGCGICVDRCFAAAMTMNGGTACPPQAARGAADAWSFALKGPSRLESRMRTNSTASSWAACRRWLTSGRGSLRASEAAVSGSGGSFSMSRRLS